MRNRLYGGVRGRKMKVGEKLLHFPPTRFLTYLSLHLQNLCQQCRILVFDCASEDEVVVP